jgi:hypothetical protein
MEDLPLPTSIKLSQSNKLLIIERRNKKTTHSHCPSHPEEDSQKPRPLQKWAKGGNSGLYPATRREAQNFPLAPKAWANFETNKVCLQFHPDPERSGNHRVVCTNCVNEMSPGTFETHKKYYIKKTAYLADANNHKPAAKNNPWLKQFRDETRRRSLPLTEYSTVIIGRKGTEFFFFLHPHKKYYMAYCTDCGWIGGLNNWQKHAVKHQTTVLDDKAEMDAELAYFTPPIQEMPEVDEEEEEVEEDKVEEDDEMGDAAVEGEGMGKTAVEGGGGGRGEGGGDSGGAAERRQQWQQRG